jgi:type IX secretion system PorP/SprF family membrane protein
MVSRMKRIMQILLLLFVAQVGMAQQQYVFTNFMLNDYYYNPAVAGSKNVHMANMAYRNQWTGFDEAPVTFLGNFYGSVRNEQKHGYGVSIISDKTGLTQNTGLYLTYAKHLKLSETVRLGLGVRPGYIQYRVRLYDAQLADEGDAVLTGNVLSANAIDMHSGFNLYSDKFFVMGSVQHLLGDQIQFTTYNASLAKHYTVIGGYNHKMEAKKLELQPSVMLKYTDPVPAQYTAMMKVTYDQKYWAGLLYRSNDAVGLSIGYRVKERLSIGYGFDYSISGISQYQSGSHEIVLSFVTSRKRTSLDEEDENLNNSILEEMSKKKN